MRYTDTGVAMGVREYNNRLLGSGGEIHETTAEVKEYSETWI